MTTSDRYKFIAMAIIPKHIILIGKPSYILLLCLGMYLSNMCIVINPYIKQAVDLKKGINFSETYAVLGTRLQIHIQSCIVCTSICTVI